MRLFVSGQRTFGAETLKRCLSLGYEVVGVASPAWRPSPEDTKRDKLRGAAERAGVPWMHADDLRAETLPARTDLIIAAHSHAFIGRKTRQRARIGAIGYHPSLLPRHRGRDAVRWAVKMGDAVTGGTVFWLTDSVDAGPIAAQDWCFIRPDDTPSALWCRELFPMGLRLIENVLADVDAGRLVMVEQDEAVATWEPSWEREPLFRPELPMLGTRTGFDVVKERRYARA